MYGHPTLYNHLVEIYSEMSSETVSITGKIVIDELKDKLEDTDTIGQFTFSKKDKKNLHSYMTRANVKVGKDTYMTQMQTDLQNVFQDPEKILIIAKLLRNDFDVSDVIRDTETKVTRKTKDKIERKSTKMKSSNSSTGRRKKALFEYFDD